MSTLKSMVLQVLSVFVQGQGDLRSPGLGLCAKVLLPSGSERIAILVDPKAIRPAGKSVEKRRVQPDEEYRDIHGKLRRCEGYPLRNGKRGAMTVECLSEKPKGPYLKQVIGEYEVDGKHYRETLVVQTWLQELNGAVAHYEDSMVSGDEAELM